MSIYPGSPAYKERLSRLRKLGDEEATREFDLLKRRGNITLDALDPKLASRLALEASEIYRPEDELLVSPQICFEAVEILGEEHFWTLLRFLDLRAVIGLNWSQAREVFKAKRYALARRTSLLEIEALKTWKTLKVDAVVEAIRKATGRTWRELNIFDSVARQTRSHYYWIDDAITFDLLTLGRAAYEEALECIEGWLSRADGDENRVMTSLHQFLPEPEEILQASPAYWKAEAVRLSEDLEESRASRADKKKLKNALLLISDGKFEAASTRRRTVISVLNKARKKRTLSQWFCQRIGTAFDHASWVAGTASAPPKARHFPRARRRSSRRRKSREDHAETRITQIISRSLAADGFEVSDEAIENVVSRLKAAVEDPDEDDSPPLTTPKEDAEVPTPIEP